MLAELRPPSLMPRALHGLPEPWTPALPLAAARPPHGERPQPLFSPCAPSKGSGGATQLDKRAAVDGALGARARGTVPAQGLWAGRHEERVSCTVTDRLFSRESQTGCSRPPLWASGREINFIPAIDSSLGGKCQCSGRAGGGQAPVPTCPVQQPHGPAWGTRSLPGDTPASASQTPLYLLEQPEAPPPPPSRPRGLGLLSMGHFTSPGPSSSPP